MLPKQGWFAPCQQEVTRSLKRREQLRTQSPQHSRSDNDRGFSAICLPKQWQNWTPHTRQADYTISMGGRHLTSIFTPDLQSSWAYGDVSELRIY